MDDDGEGQEEAKAPHDEDEAEGGEVAGPGVEGACEHVSLQTNVSQHRQQKYGLFLICMFFLHCKIYYNCSAKHHSLWKMVDIH